MDSALPRKFCDFCVRRLKEAISFRALCRRSEEILLSNYLIEEAVYEEPTIWNEEYDVEIKNEIPEQDVQLIKIEAREEPTVVFYEEITPNSPSKVPLIKTEGEDEEYEQYEILDEEQEVKPPPPPKRQYFRSPAAQEPKKRTKINDAVRNAGQPLEGIFSFIFFRP